MTDCDILHSVYPWIPSHNDCCTQSSSVYCSESKRIIGLNMAEKNYEGPIPHEIFQLSSLAYLRIVAANMTGPIPPQIGNLSSLQQLLITSMGGSLTGIIPNEIGRLTKLTELMIANLGPSDSSIYGALPTELGLLTGLTKLGITGYGLNGTIPNEFGNLTGLTQLDLHGNQLSGFIPGTLGNLTQLAYLYLGNNNLTGPIPTTFKNFSKLLHLDLSHNSLTGNIPSEIGSLTLLERLDLSYNYFDGFPSNLFDLHNIVELNLKGNNFDAPTGLIISIFTGSLPAFQIASYTLLTLTGIVCISLIIFVALLEAPKAGQTWAQYIQRGLSNFNTTLFLMLLSVISLISTELTVKPDEIYANNTMHSVLLFLFAAIWEFSYIKYSFSRSSYILETILPKSYWLIQGFDNICPLLLFIQVIPSALLTSGVTGEPLVIMYTLFPIFSGACTVLFDVLLLVSFLRYIHSSTKLDRNDSVDPRFTLICRYGGLASVGCLSSAALIFVSSGTSSSGEYFYKNRLAMVFAILLFVTAVLFSMKIHLYVHSKWEQREKSSHHKKAVELAKTGVSGGSAAGGSYAGSSMSLIKGGGTASWKTSIQETRKNSERGQSIV